MEKEWFGGRFVVKLGSRVYVLKCADEQYGGQVGEVVGFVNSGSSLEIRIPVVRFRDGTELAFRRRWLCELPVPGEGR